MKTPRRPKLLKRDLAENPQLELDKVNKELERDFIGGIYDEKKCHEKRVLIAQISKKNKGVD